MPPHPLKNLKNLKNLQKAAAKADQTRSLQPRQQAEIHRSGWLRMLAPKSAGGTELPLPEAVKKEEQIAEADGSTAWLVTLCAGAGWFAGFLPPDLAKEIISTHRLCIAGSGAPTGIATKDGEETWRLTGEWRHATGASMATHFTMNARLQEEGKPLLDSEGAQQIRAFIVPAALVTVVPGWNSTGLRATATHGFVLDDVLVPTRQAFDIRPDAATAPGPLYRFPFVSLAWVTLAANLSGMARHFMALAVETVAQRWPVINGESARPNAHRVLAEAQRHFETERERFYEALDAAWAKVCAGRPLPAADQQTLADVSRALVTAARRGVDEIYPCCGLLAADERSELNRVWRDLHTASQHAMLAP